MMNNTISLNDEVTPSPTRKLTQLFYGDPGCGKTCLLATALEVPELNPILFLDIDGNTDSIESKCNYVDDLDKILDYKEGKLQVLPCHTFDLFERAFLKIEDLNTKNQLIYPTIEIDSLTFLDYWATKRVVKTTNIKTIDPGVPDLPHFKNINYLLKNIIYRLIGLQRHTFMTAHVSYPFMEEKDPFNRPKLTGALKIDVPGIIKQTAYMQVVGSRRVLHFGQYGKFFGKDCSEGGKMGGSMPSPTIKEIYEKRYGA